MKMFKKNNKVDISHNIMKNKNLIPYGKKELIFNICSLLIVIGIGVYFGIRSFYYYSMQNITLEKASSTLNGLITTNNYVVTSGEGLHQDTEGYYFKGNVKNNYVKFGNRLFRVIRVNNDNSVKVISDDIVSEFMYGEESDYQKSNINIWLSKKEDNQYSGIYYDTLPFPEEFLVKTNYTIDSFLGESISTGKDIYSDYVTSLSIKDYSTANGKNSYLNNGKYFWIVGTDEENNVYYVGEDGSLLSGSLYECYGIRAVMTFKSDLEVLGGQGSKDDPYVINQNGKANYVDSYVNLNGDIWKVFYQKDGLLKLAYTNSVGQMAFSTVTNEFNPGINNNVGFYLNVNLFNSLTYNVHLLDMYSFTGEVSPDTSMYYTNNYLTNIISKVSLLNVFDYHNLGLDNYYLVNSTSMSGSMVYTYHNYGLLEEASIQDVKNIVPVICIAADKIEKGTGDGTFVNPFVVR